jgi:NADPH:quinone reductase-like Zn-dependent oxidoreductase
MTFGRAAALLYAAVSVGIVAFQIALAAGAPWGAYAMGGVFPGQFPLALRIAALAQAALIAGMAAVVMSRAGLILAGRSAASRWLVWLVVAFAAVSLVLNLITPSAGERAIWAPVALLLLASSAVVAIEGVSGGRRSRGVATAISPAADLTVATMQAMTQSAYGSPEVLSLRAIARPKPGPHDVLVRVHAAGLHIGDCFGVRGAPLLMRLATGLFRPKLGVPGFDLSGVVAAVGSSVTTFRPGDAVFGTSHGTCAEYAVAPDVQLALKPADLTFEQAAGVPTSALAALHGLRDAGALKRGHNVLINGAAGGIGTFAIQIAKALGAEVTGVCSTSNVELVRSIGADHVVDYTREDFTRAGRQYDLVFDNVENRSLAECRRALTPTGTLILNSGSGGRGLALLVRLLWPLVLSPFVQHNIRRYLSKPSRADLGVLKDLLESRAIRPVIDRTFPLCETAAALRYIETGHARGKVVITVG